MIFKLSEKLTYDKSGGSAETFELELVAPSKQDKKFKRKVKQMVNSGMLSLQSIAQEGNKADNDENTSMTGKDFMSLMSATDPKKFDYPEFCDFMEKSLIDFIKVDDKVNMTSSLMDKLNDDDQENLIGEWVVNFILDLPSKGKDMKSGKQKNTGTS